MSDSDRPQTPAGWYPDGQGNQRWWDGQAWTQHTAGPGENPPPPGQAEAPASDRPAPAEGAAPQGPRPDDATRVVPPRDGGAAGLGFPPPDQPGAPGAPDAAATQFAPQSGPGQPGQPAQPAGYGVPGQPGQPGQPAWQGQQYGGPGGPGGKRGLSGKLIAVIVGAAVAVVVLLVVLLLVLSGGSGPKDVAEEYFNKIVDQDCSALDLHTDELKEVSGPKSECEDDPEEYFGLEKGACDDADIEFKNEEVDGDKATVDFEIDGSDECEGGEPTGTIALEKEDDEWRISGFE